MSAGSRLEMWQQKWSAGTPAWHLADVNCTLERHYGRLCPGAAPLRVLVPLCGKTVDMLWLYQKGHTVIGIEGVQQAIEEFFNENNLKYTKSVAGSGYLFQSSDGRLQIFQADICALEPQLVGRVHAIWDRGSYVAVEVRDRPKYAAFLRAVMAADCRYLLWAVEYDASLFQGPPRHLSRDDVSAEFGASTNIEELERVPHTRETWSRLVDWGLHELTVTTYLMTPK